MAEDPLGGADDELREMLRRFLAGEGKRREAADPVRFVPKQWHERASVQAFRLAETLCCLGADFGVGIG